MHARNHRSASPIVVLWKSIIHILPEYDGKARKDISARVNYPVTSATTGPNSILYCMIRNFSPSRIVLLARALKLFTFFFTILLFVSNLIISISAVPTVAGLSSHDSSLFLLYRFSLLAKRDGRFYSKTNIRIKGFQKILQ